MKIPFPTNKIRSSLVVGILLLYVLGLCLVNFSMIPGWYDSDMYLDILYASRAWQQKTVFPEGWIFGNQFYVVSTPVIAAFLCSVLEPQMAMATASVLVSFLILVSFLWMLKPVVASIEDRLVGAVFFLAAVLYFGDAYRDLNGWQLLFTMCSYYGIYTANAFLAFGCYLRADRLHRIGFVFILAATCMLSFGTGMQSLRQTAVMTCPMIAMELLRLVYCHVRKITFDRKPLIVTALVSICNILGLIAIRMMEIPCNEMRIDFSLPTVSSVLSAIPENLLQAYKIFALGGKFQLLLFCLMALICILFAIRIVLRAVREKEEKGLVLLVLFGIGVMVVFFAGILDILQMRPIYYFMIYPMLGFLMACGYGNCDNWGKIPVLMFLVLMIASSYPDFQEDVLEPVQNRESNSCYAVADYLVENGYTTLYSEWDNYGEDVSIASGCRLWVGYWGWEYTPYESIRYLCDPAVYSQPPEQCAYLFRGFDRAELGLEAARQHNVELTPLAYFPEGDFYLFSAPVNLMR